MARPTPRRIATVLLAPVAALAAWALIGAAGIDLVISTGDGTVGAGDVLGAALAAGLGAWVVVRLIERYSSRPRARWPLVASTALALSIISPSWQADGSSAVALIALHFVTALVVIPGFAPTLPIAGRRRGGAPADQAGAVESRIASSGGAAR